MIEDKRSGRLVTRWDRMEMVRMRMGGRNISCRGMDKLAGRRRVRPMRRMCVVLLGGGDSDRERGARTVRYEMSSTQLEIETYRNMGSRGAGVCELE
jgi:hypothetical protein